MAGPTASPGFGSKEAKVSRVIHSAPSGAWPGAPAAGLGGMYEGDFSRKRTLVDYGFRLPSAVDNRPLKFAEFERMVKQVIYVSATPGPYELEHAKGEVIEQIIRPTGLVDPKVTVKPLAGQIDDVLARVRERTESNFSARWSRDSKLSAGAGLEGWLEGSLPGAVGDSTDDEAISHGDKGIAFPPPVARNDD